MCRPLLFYSLLKKHFVISVNVCNFANRKNNTIMETSSVSHENTNPLPETNRQTKGKHIVATPKERLHTVDEFVEKLEQAVIERI
jgi:hypothetical protein